MRYIEKKKPNDFDDEIKELKEEIKIVNNKSDVWDNKFKTKRKLKEYILENEQNYLCCYCEAKITLDNSHIEHIKPKYLDYENLTFDYNNLLVSCNGICFNNENKPITCGHKKGKKFDEKLFLNPVKIKNIREYFIYTDNGYIGASNLDKEKANYTMKILELNTFNNYLPEARVKALKQFRKSVKEFAKKRRKRLDEVVLLLLIRENLAFISFLRFKYGYLIPN